MERVILTAYGKYESGKTSGFGSVLEIVGPAQVAIVSMDAGLKSLGDLSGVQNNGLLFEAWRDPIREFDKALAQIEKRAGELAYWFVDGIGRLAGELELSALAGIDRDDPKNIRQVQRAYGTIWNGLRERLARLHKLPVNGYLTLLEGSRDETKKITKIDQQGNMRVTEEPTGNILTYPALAGRKVEDFFPAFCDVVIRCYTKQVVNKKITPIRPMKGFFALTRGDKWTVARVRAAPNVAIPTELSLGRIDAAGVRQFDSASDWTMARLIQALQEKAPGE